MKTNNYLSAEELKNIAPQLASLEPKNNFRVPANYFDNMHDQIMAHVAEIAETPTLASLSLYNKQQDANKLPPGYFFGLHDSIMETVTGKQQHTADNSDTPILNSIDKNNNLLDVPASYFDNLHDQIMARVTAENDDSTIDTPILNSLKAENNPFQIPENYFERLHDTIFRKVTEVVVVPSQDTDETPNLDALPKTNPFKVPNGYFEQQHEAILQKIEKNVQAPLIKMTEATSNKNSNDKGNQNAPSNIRRIFNYTASAAAAVLVFLVGYQMLDNSTDNNKDNSGFMVEAPKPVPRMEEVMWFLNNLPASDALAYVDEHRNEFDDIIENSDFVDNINLDKIATNDIEGISAENARQYIEQNIYDFDELFNQEKVIENINVKDLNLDDFDFDAVK